MPFETGICVTCHHQNEPSLIEKFAKLKIEMFDEEGLDRKKVSVTPVVEFEGSVIWCPFLPTLALLKYSQTW